jgi:hypothetical protein
MHSKASLVLGFGIMICSGWAVAAAIDWPWKAALFPLVIGIPVFCLATTEVLWVLFGSTFRSQTMDFQLSEHLPEKVRLRRTLGAIGWMLGFLGTITLLGFPIAVPLFVFLYLKLQGREGWGLSLAFTLAVWGLFYGLFDLLLHLPFPDGWIQTWIGLS